jgi:hypothetical protein
MNRVVIITLRVLLALVLLGLLFAQVVVIPIANLEFGDDIGAIDIGVFYLVIGVALVACVEVAIVATWVLLGMVRRDAIFTRRAFRWVDVIVAAGVAATIVLIVAAGHLYLVVEPHLDAPGVIVLAGTAVLCAAAFVALIVVMRGLLAKATALQGELEEVV